MSISNDDLFTLLKQDKIYMHSIENPTDEMLWWAIQNNKAVGPNHVLSEDMILYSLRNGKANFNIKQLDDIQIPEQVWIDYINECKFNTFFLNEIIKYILNSVQLTENIAMAFCLKLPIFYTDDNIRNHIPESRKSEISNVFFDGLKNNANWHFELPKGLPISDEQWQWLCDAKHLESCTGRIEHYIRDRQDTPDFVRHHILKKECYLKEWGPITADDLILWINAHKDELDSSWQCKDTIKYYLKCNDMESVLKQHGWFIKYLKNQSAKLCKTAIECDPSNIRYIKKPSDKLINYALSLDSSVSEYISKEITTKNQYPADNYLIKIREDLCDEGYLTKICIIKGKDMPDFMSRTTSLSFGNLYDDVEHEVKNIASYQPITDNELEIIRKFGLDDIQSGYFSNLD